MENKEYVTKRLIWQCGYCKDIVISLSIIKHDINYCDCGKSSVDLEEDYQRISGKVHALSMKGLTKEGWEKIY